MKLPRLRTKEPEHKDDGHDKLLEKVDELTRNLERATKSLEKTIRPKPKGAPQ